MKTVDLTHVTAEKPIWQSPKLQELGNIRRFVQTGGQKSGTHQDAQAMCTAEAMTGFC